MKKAYLLYCTLVFVLVSGFPLTTSPDYKASTASPDPNLAQITATLVMVTEYFNHTESLSGTESLINSSSTMEYNFATNSNFTTDSSPGYTMITTDGTANWTGGTNATEFPELIVFVNENNPSEKPTLNATSTAKDLDDKLSKAERIGAIVGGIMGLVVLGSIVAIYFLYRKYHGEYADF
ncbi:hypothetical protein Aperf_G00000116551 [Anoplocephala perfoliata]